MLRTFTGWASFRLIYVPVDRLIYWSLPVYSVLNNWQFRNVNSNRMQDRMDDMRTTRYGYFSTDDLGESTEGKNELGVDCLYVITCMPPFVVALVHTEWKSKVHTDLFTDQQG
jgi:hypothetical protein